MFGDNLHPHEVLYNASSGHERRGKEYDSPQKYEVCVNISDYTPSDISIRLVDGNKAIKVEGKHDADPHFSQNELSMQGISNDFDAHRSRAFSEKYYLPATANPSTMTHEFVPSQGHVLITVMKKGYEQKDSNTYISGLQFKGDNHNKLHMSSKIDVSKSQTKKENESHIDTGNETSLPPLPSMSTSAYGSCSGYNLSKTTSSGQALSKHLIDTNAHSANNLSKTTSSGQALSKHLVDTNARSTNNLSKTTSSAQALAKHLADINAHPSKHLSKTTSPTQARAAYLVDITANPTSLPPLPSSIGIVSPACQTSTVWPGQSHSSGNNLFTPSKPAPTSKSSDVVDPYLVNMTGALIAKYEKNAADREENCVKPDPAELEELLKMDFTGGKSGTNKNT